jgi:hypothetical protein
MAVCEGKAESARGVATRYTSIIQCVPNGVGLGVPMCWSRGRKVFASYVVNEWCGFPSGEDEDGGAGGV